MRKLFVSTLLLLIPLNLLFSTLPAVADFNSPKPIKLTVADGPMSKENPGDINLMIHYKTGFWGAIEKGQMEVTMPDGEICKGDFPAFVNIDKSNFNSGCIFDYNTWEKYLEKEFTGIWSMPVRRTSATLTGDKGTIITAEYIRFGHGAMSAGRFLAKDNKENIYKAILIK